MANLLWFLFFFHFITKANKGLFDTMNKMFLVFKFLLVYFEQSWQDYKKNKWITVYINAIWKKLIKYYNKTDDILAYIITTILNPLYK